MATICSWGTHGPMLQKWAVLALGGSGSFCTATWHAQEHVLRASDDVCCCILWMEFLMCSWGEPKEIPCTVVVLSCSGYFVIVLLRCLNIMGFSYGCFKGTNFCLVEFGHNACALIHSWNFKLPEGIDRWRLAIVMPRRKAYGVCRWL